MVGLKYRGRFVLKMVVEENAAKNGTLGVRRSRKSTIQTMI
jgi:hypothetical protein